MSCRIRTHLLHFVCSSEAPFGILRQARDLRIANHPSPECLKEPTGAMGAVHGVHLKYAAMSAMCGTCAWRSHGAGLPDDAVDAEGVLDPALPRPKGRGVLHRPG